MGALQYIELLRMPQNLGVNTCPDPVGHFGFCRRCGVAGGVRVPPAPLGWYSWVFSLDLSWVRAGVAQLLLEDGNVREVCFLCFVVFNSNSI